MSPQPPRAPAGADLHVHSTHSDGSLAPGDLLRAAAQAGLAGLAFTDHDATSAYPAARAEADRLQIELIPGIEIAGAWNHRRLDLLGYFLQHDHPLILQHMNHMREARRQRLHHMAALLQDRGLLVDPAALAAAFPRAMLGRRHLARYLLQTRQIPTLKHAFQHWLRDGAPCALPLPHLELPQAVQLIRNSGGVAALAHPGPKLQRTELEQLRELGIEAVEILTPPRRAATPSHLARWANDLHLIPVAGSDFHDPGAGRRLGASRTSPEALEHLRSLARSRQAA